MIFGTLDTMQRLIIAAAKHLEFWIDDDGPIVPVGFGEQWIRITRELWSVHV